ncbi:facilitated trehalose transporter Tret1-2 homolog isoform X2 [Nylanderia fulva]|uniref:facilitated trehalose transporter Tret1-2 homolog isoform X2 n=1 Tax=Nylanderia fulva TaxID=613905 RepID=UPI0010FB1FC5|nr:facilitated trehalose transporter Tret1-2 homolog isoform X2 [Nylanderia fulva]
MALESRLSHSNEEGHPMLNSSNYNTHTLDNENNNNNDNVKSGKSSFQKEDAVVLHSNAKGVLAQCLVTGAVLLLAMGGGMPIGYSAVLLPQLSRNNSALYVDREVGSWIASVHSLTTPVGSLLSGPLLDMIGRRGSLQLCAIPLCVGWLIIGFSRCVTAILIGRLVCGLSVGMMAVPVQVLVTEMAYPGLRGFLVVGSFASYCFGILLVYVLGASFNWDVVAFSGIVPPVLAFIALCLVPESPAWLVRRKKIEKAKEALLWLRGGDIAQVNVEIAVLNAGMRAEVDERPVSLKEKISSAVSIMRDPGVLKPFMIINIFNILQLFCGTYIIVFYAVDMIKDIGDSNIDNYLAAVVTAAIRFIFSIVSCILLLKVGRRPLGIISAFGTALASLTLSGYMLVRQKGSSVDAYLLAVCLLLYVGANTLGVLTLPALMSGELMPLRARGIGSGCSFFIFNLLMFFATKCFPWINNAVGVSGVFAIFGLSALLETIFIYLALPETKNCTLQQIEDYFQQSNLLWITRTRTRRDAFVPVNATSV